jgi:Cu/Ag efflux pump CusA
MSSWLVVKFDRSKYRLVYAGQFENQDRAHARLVLILGLVLGHMVLLLFAEFGKLHQAWRLTIPSTSGSTVTVWRRP